jgi:large subunit ribosomal protein L9
MKIILLETVYKHGVAGEIVEVADGFARNYLIPKGLATKANASAMKRYEKIREAAEIRREEYENMLNDLGRRIDGTELLFFRRAANSGKLFGSVTTQDIAEALDEATGVDINRRRISQQGLRDVGLHEVAVRLGTDISPILQVRVLPEDVQIAYQRQVEAVAEGLLDEIQYDDTGMLIVEDLDKLRARKERAEAEAEASAEMEEAREADEEEAAETAPVSQFEDIEIPPASDSDDLDDETVGE